MTTGDRMETDYLWLKQDRNPDAATNFRFHGYNYVMKRVPNKQERIEMIYRSMGRQSDWDLEKIRCGRKQIDRCNKRRAFKNLFRLFKHPIGYTWWKTYKWFGGSARYLVSYGWFLMVVGFLNHFREAKNIDAKNRWLVRSGQNMDGSGLTKVGYKHVK